MNNRRYMADAYSTAARLNYEAALARDNAISGNFTNLFENLGNIGRENYLSRQVGWKLQKGLDGNYSLGDMGTVIDLTGCTLDNVLYEVSAQRPVIAKTGENSSVVIVGYDEYNTYLYDPATGQISPYGMNDSTALFESAGNVFLTYIENVIE